MGKVTVGELLNINHANVPDHNEHNYEFPTGRRFLFPPNQRRREKSLDSSEEPKAKRYAGAGGQEKKRLRRKKLGFPMLLHAQRDRESCVSVYCRLRKQRLSSRTSRLLRSRRLSASHKGRFKGSHLPILCVEN
ncbi:hypothetical protein Tco_1309460 [Tanacetum coccineum]